MHERTAPVLLHWVDSDPKSPIEVGEHLAIHGIDDLPTWNCKHIANASMRGKIASICNGCGLPAVDYLHNVRAAKGLTMEPADPIIDETHAIREAVSAASGNDMQKIAVAIRACQSSGNREVVTLPPKRIVEKKAS